MQVILYIVLIYGGFFGVSWLFGEIGKWNEKRKSDVRNKVATEVVPNTVINDEIVKEYTDKLNQIGYVKDQGYSLFWKDLMSDGKKSYRGLIDKCPICGDSLKIVKGQYGKFLGCSRFPKCTYTKNLDTAKSEYKDKSKKDFFETFNSAYQ